MRLIRFFGLPLSLVFACCACKPKGPATQVQADQALATVLVEETAKLAGAKKQLVVISPGGVWGSASSLEQDVKAALGKKGFSIAATKTVDVGDPMRSGTIGLKGADFLGILDQSPDVGAIISFAGAPLLKPGDNARPEHPPVLVVATAQIGTSPGLPGDRMQLARLLDSKLIQLAIVDVSEPPPAGNTDAIHELFAQHYRILRAPE